MTLERFAPVGSAAAGRMETIGWVAAALGGAVIGGVAVAIAGPAVGLLLILAVPAVAALVVAPGVVLAAYLMIPFFKAAASPYSPFDLTVVLALANAVQVVPLLLERRRHRISRTGVLLWCGIAIIMLAGVLYAPDQTLAADKVVNYLVLVVAAMLPSCLRVGADERWIRQFLYSFLLVGVVTVLLGLSQLSTNQRLVVLEMNTIQVARAALVATVLGIALVVPRHQLPLTIGVALLVPASVIVAIASGSRGPILMVVAVALIGGARHVVVHRTHAWRPILGAIALALLSLVIFSMLAADLPAASLGRFGSLASFLTGESTGEVTRTETSAAARVAFAAFSAAMFTDHPLIGAGTGGFQALFQAAHGPDAAAWPHNAFLQVAAEHGLVGLSLFVGMLIAAFSRRLPAGSTHLALRALALFFLLNAVVSGDIFTERETLGLILLLLAVSSSTPSATPSDASAGSPQVSAASSP